MRTKEWLKSRLQDGETLTAEVLSELLESYWHKSETGRVAMGDEQPVSGGQVADALADLRRGIEEDVFRMVEEFLKNNLTSFLEDYVRRAEHDEQRERTITEERQWVTQQLAGLAKSEDVEERFRVRDEEVSRRFDDRLESYALKDKVAELVDFTPFARVADLEPFAKKSELPDVSNLATKSDFATFQGNVNASLDTKADKQYVDTAAETAENNAKNDASNKYALLSGFDDSGIYQRAAIIEP